nr:hypothetical protein [Oceanococcus sp. HetDA_MAG_MS8]
MREILTLTGICLATFSVLTWAQSPDATVAARIQALYDQPDPSQRAWLEQWLDYPQRSDASFAESRAGHAPSRLSMAAMANAALMQLDIAAKVQELQAGWKELPQAGQASEVEIQAWSRWLHSCDPLPPEVLAAGPEHAWPEPLLAYLAQRIDAPDWRHTWLERAQSASSLRHIQRELPNLSHTELQALSHNPALSNQAWKAWGRRAAVGDPRAQKILAAAWSTQTDLPAVAAGLALWPAALQQAHRWKSTKALGSAERKLAALVLIHAGSNVVDD